LVPLETLVGSPLGAEASVSLTSGQKALFSTSSIVASGTILRRITVQSGAELVFADQELQFGVREIRVNEGGRLWMGSETCPLLNSISVTFHGSRGDSSLIPFDSNTNSVSKGLVVQGQADIHSKKFLPTWTRLSRTADVGDNYITLGQLVNWEPGQEILVVTTAWYDCAESYKSACGNTSPQNERFTIVSVQLNETESIIELSGPLVHAHFSGPEYQGEVALLNRSITFIGSSAGDFGGHTMVGGSSAQGRFSNVATVNFGQRNVLTRYPFHFHLISDASNSYFDSCVVFNSNFRAVVVHGTSKAKIARCVAVNVVGNAYYLEDGVEEMNTFEYNLGAHVHPIKSLATQGDQEGATYTQASDLIVPVDTAPCVFYISNAYNTYFANAASGGWSGFCFPGLPSPIGSFLGDPRKPFERPILKFKSNVCHSTGWAWVRHGSAVYSGGWLLSSGGKLVYSTGRYAPGIGDILRYPKFPNGTITTSLLEDTKMWASFKGIATWGANLVSRNGETHDIHQSHMVSLFIYLLSIYFLPL
jgi:hypothetical protein